MSLRTLIPLSLLLFCLNPAQASGAARDWSGVWRGTLGGKPVTVCRDASGGVYYYQRHRRPLFLEPSDDGPGLTERSDAAVTGRWTLTDIGAKTVSGRWSRPDGGGTLPIRLDRVSPAPGPDSGRSACGDDAFYRGLQSREHFERSDASFNGKRYRRVAVTLPGNGRLSATTLELTEDEQYATDINAMMSTLLLAPDMLAVRMRICEQEALQADSSATGCIFQQTVMPVHWTERWLIVRSRLQIGMGEETRYVTFDLNSGTLAQPTYWFGWIGQSDNDGEYWSLNDEVGTVVRAYAPGARSGEPCADAYVSARPRYTMTILREGMLFGSNFAEGGRFDCDEAFLVPYVALEPFATDSGRADMRSLSQGR